MDNKQDRQFYWEVKNFLSKNSVPTGTPNNKPNINDAAKLVLEQNKVTKANGFNPNIASGNVINQALSAIEATNKKGVPSIPGLTKNKYGNQFSVIKEGIFDDVADAVNSVSPGMGAGLKVAGSVANTGAGVPTMSPAQSQNTQGAGVGISQIQPAGAGAGAPPAGAPAPGGPSVYGGPPTGGPSAPKSKADYGDDLRTARAMPGGYGEASTPEGRAANKAARDAKNAAMAAANIGKRRIEDDEREQRRQENKRRYKEDEALEYENETGETLEKDGTVPADTAANRAKLKDFRKQKQTEKMSSSFAGDIESLSAKDPSELTASETGKLAFARSVMSKDANVASATEKKVKDSINAQSGNVSKGSQAASRTLGAIGNMFGGDVGNALSAAGQAMGNAGSSIVNNKADEMMGKTVGRSTEDLRNATQEKIAVEGEQKKAENEALAAEQRKKAEQEGAKRTQLNKDRFKSVRSQLNQP